MSDLPESLYSLRTALRMRGLAQEDAEAFSTVFAGLSAVAGSRRDGFWFLSFVATGPWVLALAPVLRRELEKRPADLVWPVGRMLARVAAADAEAVVASGLLPVLWSGGEEAHLWQALSVMEEGRLWEHEAVAPLLTEAPTAWPEGLGQIAFQLASYGKESHAPARFALGWLVEWLKVAPERDVTRGAFRVSVPFALAELAEAQPDAVLESAIPLLDAALSRQAPEDVVFRLQHHFGADLRGEAPVLQVRRVLADKLQDGDERPTVLSILADLLHSDNAAKRALALDVAKEDPLGCKALVVEATRDTRNFDRNLSQWMDYLIREVYPDLSDEDKGGVEEALVRLPDEAPDEGKSGFIKLHALAAIPEELRSDEVRRAIANVYERFRDLPEPPYEPHQPGGEMSGAAYTVGEEVDDEVTSLLDQPLALIDHYLEVWEASEDARESGWHSPIDAELSAALARAPDSIEALSDALATRTSDLPDRLVAALVTAIAGAIRTSEDVGGQVAYHVANTLGHALTSEARDDLARVLADRWDQIRPEEHADVVELLTRWLQEEPEPTDEDTERRLAEVDASYAATAGLNSRRGAIAVALVDIAAQTEGEVQQAALGGVMAASDDPSPLVRAVVSLWIGKLIGKAEHDWLVEAAQRCTADFSPYVLPSIPHVFRGLEADEIGKFGANVVRVMLASGDEAAKGAGFLAAIWSLRHPSEETVTLVDEVFACDSNAAKEEAAHVFAHNVLDENEATRVECKRRIREILDVQPAEVREAAIRYLPDPPEEPSMLTDLLRKAALDPEGATFPAIDTVLYRHAKKDEERWPKVVAAIVAGLLDNQTPEVVGQYLQTASHMLGDVYNVLRAESQDDLALRLLDAACYHCVPAAADLLDDAKELLQEMGELPDGE